MLQTKATQASAAIRSGPGALAGVLLTAGSDAASVTIYDNASAASGDKLAVVKAAANSSAAWSPPDAQICSSGLYAEVTGTTPDIFITYL